MERSLEQRYAITFCVRLAKNAIETFYILQEAFIVDCISRSRSGKWHKAFKEGQEEVADEPRSGRPTTDRTEENVDRVREILRTNHRLIIQQIADTLHMSTFVVHGIVTEDLQMRKVCVKLVPKVLMQDKKGLRVLRCQELLDLIQNEPDFLNSVITGDESWMF
ncbi:protein GVQW3 [Trichonephila clavipes]|nr:protein GVQW3 [Trichonephila clavipes]